MPDEITPTEAAPDDSDYSLGVSDDGGAAPEGAEAAPEEEPSQRLEPIRDDSGVDRLMPMPGEEDPPAEIPPEVEPEVTKTWSVGGKEYTDPSEAFAAAEHALKSSDGRLRAEQTKRAQVERLNSDWQVWFDTEGRKHAEPRAEATDREPGKPKGPLDAIDWERIDRVGKEEGFVPALQAAFMQYKDVLKSEFDESVAPVREAHQNTTAAREYQTHFAEVVEANANGFREDGTAYYPEINEHSPDFDPVAAKNVMNYLVRLAQESPQFAASPRGVHTAYREWLLFSRENNYQKAGAEAPAPEVTPPPAGPAPSAREAVTNRQAAKVAAGNVRRDAQGRILKSQRAAASAGVEGGGPTPRHIAEDSRENTAKTRGDLKRAIKNAGSGGDSFLGVWPD